ncbi:MAG: hypothetical protein DRQ98_11480 [Gammaproteobacteria bacterium]|nr:MAG: hypothetical protein DRQ98_11480 [Gammaproteobacteria bacterium]
MGALGGILATLLITVVPAGVRALLKVLTVDTVKEEDPTEEGDRANLRKGRRTRGPQEQGVQQTPIPEKDAVMETLDISPGLSSLGTVADEERTPPLVGSRPAIRVQAQRTGEVMRVSPLLGWPQTNDFGTFWTDLAMDGS